MVAVKFDIENHLSSRREVPDLDQVVDYLRRIPGPKVLGVVDWKDGRFNRLINSKPELSEPLDGNAFYVGGADTILFRGEEIETDLGHMLALGLDKSYNFPKVSKMERFGEICDERNFVAIVGDCPDYGKIREQFYLHRNKDLWGKFDGVKTWASEVDPRDLKKYSRARSFFNTLSAEFSRDRKGQIVTTDGHRMNMFRSYNEVDLDWEKFRERDVVKNLKKSIGKFNMKHSVQKMDWVGIFTHSLMAGWDNILKNKIPGFNPGDPFSKDYEPGKIEKWFFDRGIGPYKA